MKNTVLAVDLGGTNLRMAAIAEGGEILHQSRTETPRNLDPAGLITVLRKMSDECRCELTGEHQVSGIAAGVPANINSEGILHNLPNLPGLSGMNLKGDLEAEFRLPATIENDATAAAIGENWLGASRAVNDSIMVTLGTGVGGGIIIGNKPLRGIDGTAGKIGHMCVEPEGVECKCGSRGCIEQYASATAIVRMAREAGLETNSSRDVYDSYMNGDQRAASVFQKVGYYLGITLAGLLNALNPEMVIIGGGAAAGWDAFIGPLRNEISKRAFSEPVARAGIVRSELGDDAGILGAARSAFLNV